MSVRTLHESARVVASSATASRVNNRSVTLLRSQRREHYECREPEWWDYQLDVAAEYLRKAAAIWMSVVDIPKSPYADHIPSSDNEFLAVAERAFTDEYIRYEPCCAPPIPEPVRPLTTPQRIKLLLEVVHRDGWDCAYCHQPQTPDTATIDHVRPQSKGGTHDPDNLVVACRSCNSRKADRWDGGYE